MNGVVLCQESLVRKYLFIFGFETPAMMKSNCEWNSDFEDSNSVFIEATNEADALQCGRTMANQFLVAVHKSHSPCVDDYAHWIAENPEKEFAADALIQIPTVDCRDSDLCRRVVDEWIGEVPNENA